MREIAVRKHDFLNLMLFDQSFELVFSIDGDASWIEFPCKNCRIGSVGYPWNLRCSKTHHFITRIIAVYNVKVMEVPSCCAHDENACTFHCLTHRMFLPNKVYKDY